MVAVGLQEFLVILDQQGHQDLWEKRDKEEHQENLVRRAVTVLMDKKDQQDQ